MYQEPERLRRLQMPEECERHPLTMVPESEPPLALTMHPESERLQRLQMVPQSDRLALALAHLPEDSECPTWLSYRPPTNDQCGDCQQSFCPSCLKWCAGCEKQLCNQCTHRQCSCDLLHLSSTYCCTASYCSDCFETRALRKRQAFWALLVSIIVQSLLWYRVLGYDFNETLAIYNFLLHLAFLLLIRY